MYTSFLIQPITNLLLVLYGALGANMGWAIIALTLILRVILLPFNLPAVKAGVKQKELAPELAKLKEQYGKDKKGFAAAQMELMKKHGFNPLAGCLPQILQIVVLFALYKVFIDVLGRGGINTSFFYLDLGKPDPFVILPILAGVAQFITSKVMMPAVKKGEALAEKTDDNKDDLMYNMQKQMLYFMPVMTVVIGYKLPSGLALYWFVTTLFSLVQQVLLQKVYTKK